MSEDERDVGDQRRPITIAREVDAPPEVVWRTITNPSEIIKWFPLEARVEPRVGGKVWISWGPGVEGEAPIHVWEPPRRFGWTEEHGADEQGRPIRLAVDFYVEAREGTTVVRLVQSGFSASSDWDGMYDALRDGWTYFLFNLAFYLAKHRGKSRRMVWTRVATDLARDQLWERLIGGALVSAAAGGTAGADFDLHLAADHTGEIVSTRPGHYFTGTLPSLDDSLLFVELEGKHVGIWLSTYGTEADVAHRLQAELDERVETALSNG